MTSASSSDKGWKVVCEEVVNICEQATLRKQNRGFFQFWKTVTKMGFVSGHEGFAASTLRGAAGRVSNCLKRRLLPCEVVVSLYNKCCTWTAGEKDRRDFRA